ncbi:cytochrome o ubiquinol oxidase subunit III [Blochmannia endosymbiont of Polyrhachis (Hedomyrma) turneri]|uniref:cytochrome o ubiquinol oxidase subunit III n=1 Tax=Blochmannia endosymbiont of Polyrhachis (Hedomyrma) turneri TaxID=1505596 RepID=UPI00061A71FB|nr:cytochrome o ubiquinol oxidase subunit III [Blochmannia endosymbiont of Polyrhachis (Hedomyrma) turneri]AKC59813.1 Cytochrome o ubiquinol oxidase subunit 3 [Blochmannia endosymbiont of Polyrhachis (Hedomyrma) turneri]
MNNNLSNIKKFGFWLYIMSDSILFATLFAVYIILKNNIADGPSGKDIFNLPFVFIETLLLLISSITYTMVSIATNTNNKKMINIWMIITFLFGCCFCIMEIHEFYHLIGKNYGPWRSGFLSSLFTLLGTHALHVLSGLIWIIIMMIHIYQFGVTIDNKIRLQCLSIFWHFLDIIWICVFTFVYLFGMI